MIVFVVIVVTFRDRVFVDYLIYYTRRRFLWSFTTSRNNAAAGYDITTVTRDLGKEDDRVPLEATATAICSTRAANNDLF